MDWLRIDDWWEMLVAGVVSGGTVIGVISMVLRFLDKRKTIKAGPVELGGDAMVEKTDRRRGDEDTLARIEAMQSRLMERMDKVVLRVNSTDEIAGALIENAAIVNKWVRQQLGRTEREDQQINGDLDEADEAVGRAKKLYREGRRVPA